MKAHWATKNTSIGATIAALRVTTNTGSSKRPYRVQVDFQCQISLSRLQAKPTLNDSALRSPRRFPAERSCALIGTLGAGKTRLVQAFAAAHGVPREAATSPTFVLVNEYHGRLPIYHFDAYRLRDDDEFIELGPEEYFESNGVTFVEWADRVERCLPREHLEIRCEAVGETERRFTL